MTSSEFDLDTDPQKTYPNSYSPVVPNGRICPVTGLKHGRLYALLQRGEAAKHVRVVSLREPGATRGKLLFHQGDMLRWLDRLAAQQGAERRSRDTLSGESGAIVPEAFHHSSRSLTQNDSKPAKS